jgi:hypothetical protein
MPEYMGRPCPRANHASVVIPVGPATQAARTEIAE